MIAAGVNAKALQTFMGHASITITLDRYGHLFPGAESEAAALLDAFIDEALKRPVGKSWGSRVPRQADSDGLGRSSAEIRESGRTNRFAGTSRTR